MGEVSALSVNAEAFAGGICGEILGSVSNSVHISGAVSVGGKRVYRDLIGPVTLYGTENNNVRFISPSAAKSRSTYETLGWSFGEVWDINFRNNNRYPYLTGLPVMESSESVEGLSIKVNVPNNIYPGVEYFVRVELINESITPLSMVPVTANLNGRTLTAYEQQLATSQIIGDVSELDSPTFLYPGGSITVRVLLPGERLTVFYPVTSDIVNQEEISSYLNDVFTQLSSDGGVALIPVSIREEAEDWHISEFLSQMLQAAVDEILDGAYENFGVDFTNITAEDLRLLMAGIFVGLDDNMYFGLAQFLMGTDHDYLYRNEPMYWLARLSEKNPTPQ
jgi:hypothetical protein